MKTELRKCFKLFYANEVQKQLINNIPVNQVKIDLTLSAIKTKSASWIMSSWNEVEKRADVAINGFEKAGILDIIKKNLGLLNTLL